MADRALRAVGPGEKAPSRKQMNVAEAAASGDSREFLVSLRDRLAVTVADAKTPARDLAALSRRLQDIVEKLEAHDAREAEELRDAEAAPDEDWSEEAI